MFNFVHSFRKWLGNWLRDSHNQLLRQIAFLANEPNSKMPDIETFTIAHLSGNLVCSEALKKVPHGHIND